MQKVSTDQNDPYVKDRLLAVSPFDRVKFAETFEHRICHVAGIKIHYAVGGTGPIILFGHGWPASWYEWRKVLPLLADRFTCVAIDLPGFGDSSPPSAFDPKTISDIIKQFVEEELKQREIFIVGHDISGPPMVHLAAYNNALVKKLFITESSIAGPEMGEVLSQHINEIWHFPMNSARLSATFATGKEWNFIPQFFTDWVYNTAAITPEDIAEYIRVNQRPGAIECGAAYYSAPPALTPEGDVLPKDSISMPFKFVGGDMGFGGYLGGDKKAAFSTIERFATDAHYEVLEKCSHWVGEDRPYTIAQKIGEFFSA